MHRQFRLEADTGVYSIDIALENLYSGRISLSWIDYVEHNGIDAVMDVNDMLTLADDLAAIPVEMDGSVALTMTQHSRAITMIVVMGRADLRLLEKMLREARHYILSERRVILN